MNLDKQDKSVGIENMNAGYVAVRDMKDKLASGDVRAAFGQLGSLRATGKFVEKNIPQLSEDENKNPDGLYCPSRMMAHAIALVEQVAVAQNATETSKGVTAAEQAMRLMGFGTIEKSRNVRNDLNGTVRSMTMRLPNLVAIPREWRRGKDGEDFLANLKRFVERRQKNLPIENLDIDALNTMSDLIGKSYEGLKVDRDKADHAPLAREMILINLELLRLETSASAGKEMSATPRRVDELRLIRGLFNYDEEFEMQKQVQPSLNYAGVPRVVNQPAALKT